MNDALRSNVTTDVINNVASDVSSVVTKKATIVELIDILYTTENLSGDDLLRLLNEIDSSSKAYLHQKADEKRKSIYGNKVYMRGLIEFTNYCKNDCNYCGIRRSNKLADRYRLTEEQIIECCQVGYDLGYRTFVLQGGEDAYYTDERLVQLFQRIKSEYPDTAITLSIGEKPYESYQKYFDAGVDRYLLRHETNSRELYEALHPDMLYDERIRCLNDLKSIGFQVGAGFMVGLPNQKNEDYVKDLIFLKNLPCILALR